MIVVVVGGRDDTGTGVAGGSVPVTVERGVEQRLLDYSRQANGAFARATERAWASDLKLFSTWCVKHGQASLPADPNTIVEFVRDLARTRKPSTLARYLSSIGHAHRAGGVPDPTNTDVVVLSMRTLRRTKGTAQRQARGLTQDDVDSLVKSIPNNLRGLRDRALILVGRDLLARRSELVSMTVEDLTWGRGRRTATAVIRRSKTDQDGGGATLYLGAEATEALRAWLREGQIESGPLFRKVDRHGQVWARSLTAAAVREMLRARSAEAGLDGADEVSGHSLRVGMAQDLIAAGAELPAVMQAGRWQSQTMPARYGRHLLAERNAVAEYHRRRNHTSKRA